jgi:hypothetical protein
VSDPSDRTDEPRPAPSDHELEVDLGAFLPEGSVLAGPGDEPDAALAAAGGDHGWGDEGDEPEVPAWARDDPDHESAASAPVAGVPAPDPAPPAAQVPVGSADAPAPPTVDVAVLERIEGDLAAVDEALSAIDAGDPGRSALLVELVGSDLAPPAEA